MALLKWNCYDQQIQNLFILSQICGEQIWDKTDQLTSMRSPQMLTPNKVKMKLSDYCRVNIVSKGEVVIPLG